MSAKIKKKGNKSDYEKYPNLSFNPHKQQKVSRLKTADQNSDCNCINLQIKILLYRRQKHVTLWSWECDVFLSHLFIYFSYLRFWIGQFSYEQSNFCGRLQHQMALHCRSYSNSVLFDWRSCHSYSRCTSLSPEMQIFNTIVSLLITDYFVLFFLNFETQFL